MAIRRERWIRCKSEADSKVWMGERADYQRDLGRFVCEQSICFVLVYHGIPNP